MSIVKNHKLQEKLLMRRNGIGIRTAQLMSERIVGQIHVYDGASKGKSQAALGVVLRSIGLGIHSDSPTRVLLLSLIHI